VSSLRVLKASVVEVTDAPALTGAAAARLAAESAAHRQALEAAYRQGVDDGWAEAERHGVAAAPEVAAAVERAATAVAAAASAQAAADRAELVDAAIELAQWVLRRELATDPAAMLDRLNEAMASLRSAPTIEVRVTPGMVALVQDWAAPEVTVVADPSLEPGEAKVHAGHAHADLTFAQAFSRARGALGADQQSARGVLDA
jgi:flagellar biosynthesis/type III secretory pathway protein FliH